MLKPELDFQFNAPPSMDDEERTKLNAALQRAIPVARMVDYGVPQADALKIHEMLQSDSLELFDQAVERLARRYFLIAQETETDANRIGAAQAWRNAAALYQIAQLAYNADIPRKCKLYEYARTAMQGHARCTDDLEELFIETSKGTMYGWSVHPNGQPVKGSVLIIGGLSGWGSVYLDMARALVVRGFAAILVEGPGQGSTRLRSKINFGRDSLDLLQGFVAHARSMYGPCIGIWGNSFGGLIAAHVAAGNSEIGALCVNGAPMIPELPSFRTALEQMNAFFGMKDDAELSHCLESLAMKPEKYRIHCPVLIVEGGMDPLVRPGSQESFYSLAPDQRHDRFYWPDGDHTIYNHAAERNARVAEWFKSILSNRTED